MEFSQKLYKLDSKGKERILHIWTLRGDLNQESGLLEGAKVLHSKTCTPKNVGKSNETTADAQAILQARSKMEEKLTEGYFKTIEEAKTTSIVMPMLAEDYKKYSNKIKWLEQVFTQPKLDGMRCFIVVEKGIIKLVSRAGKEILTMQHIKDIIQPILSTTSNFILDGELYAHGLNFQENMRLLKKVRPGETEKVGFHMYDVVSTQPFIKRYDFVKLIVSKCDSLLINLVNTIQIHSENDLLTCYKQFISEGYEGAMVRHSDSGYESNKRSINLLKYKEFQDIALPIIDIVANEANPLHGTPVFEIKDKQFKSGCKLSHEEREDLLTNKDKYIGKTAEIRFFEYSEDGILRFPVMVGIRLDK